MLPMTMLLPMSMSIDSSNCFCFLNTEFPLIISQTALFHSHWTLAIQTTVCIQYILQRFVSLSWDRVTSFWLKFQKKKSFNTSFKTTTSTTKMRSSKYSVIILLYMYLAILKCFILIFLFSNTNF